MGRVKPEKCISFTERPHKVRSQSEPKGNALLQRGHADRVKPSKCSIVFLRRGHLNRVNPRKVSFYGVTREATLAE